MPVLPLNLVAIVVSVIAYMFIGMAWYSPVFFRKSWLKATGKTTPDFTNPKRAYALTALSALVLSLVMAHFVRYTGATTFVLGAQTGFWAWLGFFAAPVVVDYLFTGRDLMVYYIFGGYQLVAFVIMGIILAVI